MGRHEVIPRNMRASRAMLSDAARREREIMADESRRELRIVGEALGEMQVRQGRVTARFDNPCFTMGDVLRFRDRLADATGNLVQVQWMVDEMGVPTGLKLWSDCDV